MQQGIAPRMFIVNGRPSPCSCHDNVICEFCVQANLIAWERAESKKKSHPGKLVNTLKKLKQRRVAEALGVSDRMVRKILKRKEIPKKYAQRFYRNYEKGYLGKGEQKSVPLFGG